MESLCKPLTRDQLKSFSLIDTSDPIWILGPSSRLNNYKDFILNNLQDKNTIAVGHTFPHIVLNWSFLPNFFTWYDPHQTSSTIKYFEKIENLYRDKNKKSMAVVADFSKNIDTFPVSSKFANDMDLWDEYMLFQGKLVNSKHLNIIYAKSMFLHWVNLGLARGRNIKGTVECNPSDIDMELTDKLCFNPDYRFNQYDKTTFGTRKKYPNPRDPRNCSLENILTSTLFPILYFMNFKKIFIMGFDGLPSRIYGSCEIHPDHKNFCGLEEWSKWKDFHGMDLISLQEDSPISKTLKFISPENSLQYV